MKIYQKANNVSLKIFEKEKIYFRLITNRTHPSGERHITKTPSSLRQKVIAIASIKWRYPGFFACECRRLVIFSVATKRKSLSNFRFRIFLASDNSEVGVGFATGGTVRHNG